MKFKLNKGNEEEGEEKKWSLHQNKHMNRQSKSC